MGNKKDITIQIKAFQLEAQTVMNDTAVPVEQAKELDELLPDSKLIVLPGTHYLYLEKIREVSNLINEFIKEEA